MWNSKLFFRFSLKDKLYHSTVHGVLYSVIVSWAAETRPIDSQSVQKGQKRQQENVFPLVEHLLPQDNLLLVDG